jgi:hypothetical protein
MRLKEAPNTHPHYYCNSVVNYVVPLPGSACRFRSRRARQFFSKCDGGHAIGEWIKSRTKCISSLLLLLSIPTCNPVPSRAPGASSSCMLRRIRCPPSLLLPRPFNPISSPSKHELNSRAVHFRAMPISVSHICRSFASSPGRGPPINFSSLKIKVVAIFTNRSLIPQIYCMCMFTILFKFRASFLLLPLPGN